MKAKTLDASSIKMVATCMFFGVTHCLMYIYRVQYIIFYYVFKLRGSFSSNSHFGFTLAFE
jgi:hypothetical protein